MESTNTYTSTTETLQTSGKTPAQNATRKAAMNALAIVGFLVLVILGILLAIYSSRFIPDAVNKLTFKNPVPNQEGNAQLATIPATTLPFAEGTSSVVSLPQVTPISNSAVRGTTSYASTNSSAQAAAYQAPKLYGLPNLTTTIIATGFLANGTTESFVPAQVIPAGARAAVRFSIANTGTNVSGPWQFSAGIPTQNGYVFTGPVEQSLAPGDHIVFTLGFDQANLGANQPIVVTADPQGHVAESTEVDNSRSATITVLP
jgi:hypothetical protein